MSEKANYFKLGLFVLGAIAVAIALLVILGGGRLFQRSLTIETYFDESVQGLDVGSKVRYRGVIVGEVHKISFTYTQYESDKPPDQRKQYVYVSARVRPELAGNSTPWSEARLEGEISRGLRVRLAAQGITGQEYLEIDYLNPETNSPLPIDWTPDNTYIPSARSAVTRFVDEVERVMNHLEKVDLESLVNKLDRLLGTLNSQAEQLKLGELSRHADRVLGQIESAHVDKLGAEATQLISELRESNVQLQSILKSPGWQTLPNDSAAVARQARQLLESPELRASITHFERVLRRLDELLAGRNADIAVSIDNLKQITDNLRDLTEQLKRSPGDLLLGVPPQRGPK